MPTADRTPAAAPDSRELRREVARVRRRARVVLLAGAVVAAVAADLWYEILSFWIFRFFRVRIWFPLFFLVAFAVFAAVVVRRTGTLRLSALLDGRFALKERLASAFGFGSIPGIAADLREAQARETLRAVDFSRLRSSFRFRPWGAFALLAAGAGFTAWLMYRYPDSFNPRGLPFNQGRVVFMTVKNLAGGRGRDGAGGSGDRDASQQGDSGHPQVALIAEKNAPGKEPPPGTPNITTDEKPPPGGEKSPGDEPEPRKKPPDHPEQSSERTPPSPDRRGERKGARPGSGDGDSKGRPLSQEETEGVTAPTARPDPGLAAGAPNLRGPGTGPSLPPMPFVRLLGGAAPAGSLFDPETLNIVLEAYPPKYREHLAAYLKALQTLAEARRPGS